MLFTPAMNKGIRTRDLEHINRGLFYLATAQPLRQRRATIPVRLKNANADHSRPHANMNHKNARA